MGTGVDELAVGARRDQLSGPISPFNLGFDLAGLALGLSDALVRCGHFLVEIKH